MYQTSFEVGKPENKVYLVSLMSKFVVVFLHVVSYIPSFGPVSCSEWSLTGCLKASATMSYVAWCLDLCGSKNSISIHPEYCRNSNMHDWFTCSSQSLSRYSGPGWSAFLNGWSSSWFKHSQFWLSSRNNSSICMRESTGLCREGIWI